MLLKGFQSATHEIGAYAIFSVASGMGSSVKWNKISNEDILT